MPEDSTSTLPTAALAARRGPASASVAALPGLEMAGKLQTGGATSSKAEVPIALPRHKEVLPDGVVDEDSDCVNETPELLSEADAEAASSGEGAPAALKDIHEPVKIVAVPLDDEDEQLVARKAPDPPGRGRTGNAKGTRGEVAGPSSSRSTSLNPAATSEMVTAARLRKNRKRSSSLKRDRGRSAVDKDLKTAQHPASAVDESVVPLIEDVTVFGDGDTGYQDGIDEAVAAAEAASSSAEAAKESRSENAECSPAQESTVASRCQAALAGAATDAGAAAQLTAAAEDLTAAGAPTAGNEEKPTALQAAPTDPTAVAAAVKLPKEHYTRSKKCREFVDGFLRKLLAPLNAHHQANGGKAGQQRGPQQSNFRRLHPRFGAFSAAGNISNIELGPERDIVKLLKYAHAIVADQPMFLELEAPINVMGDIHGQYGDLLEHFKKCGFPPRANYLLLGDYVDRGQQSLETMCLLMCYKIKYPENFFILRGNHECAYISKLYGFHDECKRKYSVKLWREFTMFFKWLPVAATVGGKIFCAHGGLSTEFFTERDGVFNPTKGKKGKGKRGGKNGGGKNGAGKQGSGKGADANQLEDWEMESSSSSGESEDEDAKKAAENTATAEKQKDLDGAAAADTSSKSSRSPTTSENEPSEATPVAHSDGSDSDESEAEREEAQRTLELVCQNATAAELAKALQLREAAGLLDDENEGNAGGEKSQNAVGDVLIGEFSAEPGSDDDDDPVSVAGFTQVWPTSPISSSDSSASPSSSRASSEDSNRSRSGVRKKKSSSSVAGAGGTKKKSSSKKRRRRLSSERSKQTGSDRKANKSPRKILEEHLRKLLADADEGKKDASVNQGAEESRDEGVKKRKSSMKKQSSAKKKGADGDKDKDKGPAEEISPSSKEELEQLDEDPDAEAPLPPDWERVSSEIVSSFGYYRNKKTGEVTQERPKPVPLVDDAAAGAGPSSAAGAGAGVAAGVVRREEETSGKVSCLSNRHENASERKLIEAVRDWVSASKPTKHQIALALEHLRLTRNVSLQDVRAAFKAAQAAEAREKPDAANQNPFLAAALSAGSAAKNAKSSKRKKGGNGNAGGDDGASATRADVADHNKRSIPSELKRQLPKIPRSKIRSLMQAKLPHRPVEIPEAGLMCDLLWSDPCPSTAFWRPNERGVSFAFGAKVVESFCKKFNIDLVCRAHQAIADGYWFFAQKRLVTVFSAPDYCGEMRNDAAILQVDEKLHCKFKVLQSSHKVMGMRRQGFGNMGGGVLGSPGRGALAMVSNNAGGRGVLGGGLLGGMNGVGRAAGAGQQEDRIVDLEKLIATGDMDWVQPGAAEDSAPASSESSDAGAPAAKKRKKA